MEIGQCLPLNFAFVFAWQMFVLICMLHSVINGHKQMCKMFSWLSLSIVGLKERVRSTTSKDVFGLGHFPALKRWDWNCSTPTRAETPWSSSHCEIQLYVCVCCCTHLQQLCLQFRCIVVLTLMFLISCQISNKNTTIVLQLVQFRN